jgi:hypothetical protein
MKSNHITFPTAGRLLCVITLSIVGAIAKAAQLRQVTLAPGERASFAIAYNAIPDGQTCTQVNKVRITPPNSDRSLTLTERLTPCGNPRAWIKVTPVEAGMK